MYSHEFAKCYISYSFILGFGDNKIFPFQLTDRAGQDLDNSYSFKR